jgi:hypothetical protein
MRTVFRSALLLLACLGWTVAAPAQIALPLELRQTNLAFNLQSQRGMPIQPIPGNPGASDGRAPVPAGQLSTSFPTTNQFQGWLGFSAIASPRSADQFVVGRSYADNADNIGLPTAKDRNGTVRAVLSHARVGATYYGRPVAFLFGSKIPVPETDETGKLLSTFIPPVDPTNYWFAEPYSTTRSALGYHTNETYYWSPHAEAVFAIQSGPIKVRWRKTTPSQTQPADYTPEKYTIESGFYYRIFTADYVVSGSAVKPTQKMFWTEGAYRSTGKTVTVPQERVGDVHIVYTDVFPDRVAQEVESPGQVPPVDDPEQRYQETRTLWYNSGQIFAYNLEGRVFVELLGDVREGQSRNHLGFEIVDVVRRPLPVDVSVELGDRMPAFEDRAPDAHLKPEPILAQGSESFTYLHKPAGSPKAQYFATRETLNVNDVFFHWLTEGEQGLFWPFRLVRYDLNWPADPARYSHYVRHASSNPLEAQATGVPLPLDSFAAIEYQDPLDRPRAGLTADSRFYTELNASQPAHRALLRYVSGGEVSFERVFSWLDAALKAPAGFEGSVGTTLAGWNPTTGTFDWADPLTAPRVVTTSVEVGRRIQPPANERLPDPDADYWSGHIRTEHGTSYHPGAYLDPFEVGFDAANLGAIIPVNAIPNRNKLEVWWFRRNTANTTLGFRPAYWPSVVAQYTLAWPASPGEIVLASNKGSGPLGSHEARGSVYSQNDAALHGYNPNEEHALVLGGTAYALRDDLNVTSGAGFSSLPFVLLQYTAEDGRPAVATFKVLREKPEAGQVFDYMVAAGTRLQAPMPLPLLEKPITTRTIRINLGWLGTLTFTIPVDRTEEPSAAAGDLPGAWSESAHLDGEFGHYRGFTYRDRKNDFWVYRALHAGPPPLQAGTLSPSASFDPPAAATAVVGVDFSYELHLSRFPASVTVQPQAGSPLPAWLRIDGTRLRGIPRDVDVGTLSVPLTLRAIDDGATVTVHVPLTVLASGTPVEQGPSSQTSENPYTGSTTTFLGRPPYLAVDPAPTNSFTMRFYYKTQESFAWPGISPAPAVGSVVPYLRPAAPGGGFQGQPGSSDTASLDVVYRPYWPFTEDTLPQFRMGDTLTTAKGKLPAVRGQSSLQLIYQQSIATNLPVATRSVVLHDPTREKMSDLLVAGLEKLPAGVRGEASRGLTQFPNLPPHLAGRLFYDPNRGTNGSLVLSGVYNDRSVGDPYLLLNVLRGNDLAEAKRLCPTGDPDKIPWDRAIDNLGTTLETFVPSETVPGTYEVDPDLNRVIGVGALAEVPSDNTAVDSYALSASGPGTGYVTFIAGNGGAFTPAGESVVMKILRVAPPQYVGEVKIITAENPLSELSTFQHSVDVGGRYADYEYDWRIGPPVDGREPEITESMSGWTPLAPPARDMPHFTLGGSGIQVLGDNYIVLRYRPKDPTHPLFDQWSAWTTPQLAEGWIKRVLAGINPFNQRITDLYNNRANTDVSLLTQAGQRWEGDIALSLEALNGYGLIEIYETVLRRGKSLSIDADINFGPANDALLLAAGYLNDLYSILGGEAWADASNPTIGIGTKDRTYGDIATALFAFKGQTSSLLEEELALLRGRDDFLQPGVVTRPVYNRLFWNYTRGIDAGEVIYALNYNIQEDADGGVDGAVNAEDARKMFPQGHGDAYGHFLTGLKGYYKLLLDTDFDWVPRSEAVTVLGKPVQVDYQDERKFAAAAASVARTGRQVFDLTWRRDYQGNSRPGWSHLEETRENTRRTPSTTRYWGLDHWASRTGQGAYFNWVVGNAILPDVDPDETHEGITKIDRTTVPELKELASTAQELQTSMDNAAGRVSPLGIPEDAIAFDIQPQQVVAGTASSTHFEQVYDRATRALQNAVAAFDDAKDVTRLLRSEQDSLADFQAAVDEQERAYNRRLIELYGSPYPDDIGPGKTWKQGYEGPDLLHYMWVDLVDLVFPELWNHTETLDMPIDLSDLPAAWQNLTNTQAKPFDIDWKGNVFSSIGLITPNSDTANYTNYLQYNLGPHGFSDKPATFTGKRASPGELQQAISEIILAHRRVKQALYDSYGNKAVFDRSMKLFQEKADNLKANLKLSKEVNDLEKEIADLESTYAILTKDLTTSIAVADMIKDVALSGMPEESIFGLAFGGDVLFPVRAIIAGLYSVAKLSMLAADAGSFRTSQGNIKEKRESIQTKVKAIADTELRITLVEGVDELFHQLESIQGALETISVRLREFDDAQRNYRGLLAGGLRLQDEREVHRRRAAAVTQGFRTRDAAFRIFRTEKLERYKTLFDLAARYTLLAANAYDYETGLLHTDEGRAFVQRILQSRALGVVHDGSPQFAGSNTGDPGLSSVLAEMKADWDVLRGRLGFNNPDGYGTTVSLRAENHRILPGADGTDAWRDVLERGRVPNLLDDQDVQRYCMQISRGDGLPVPGIVLEFATTIADGLNLFGRPLAAGDSAFSASSFATKIFAAGVALEGYKGMADPAANTGAVGFAGGSSPSDPAVTFLDPTALSATPYVYLIPVGADSMRSPPLGDASTIRTWNVSDVTIPLPFNIGASTLASGSAWQSADFLTEPMFGIRKHQAFRPVSSAAVFDRDVYNETGGFAASSFTNRRLIGRSVWNSKWKLVIPGHTLLNDPNDGLDRLVRNLRDVKLHFVTYSYSGN